MLDWKSLINKALPKVGSITRKTVQRTVENAYRFRGSMRISTGKIWTDAEYEAHRNHILGTPLP